MYYQTRGAGEHTVQSNCLIRVIVFSLLAIVCAEVANAQTSSVSAMPPAGQKASPDCSAADLDTSYQFKNDGPTEQIILTFRNISNRPCTLHSGDGVMFGDYRHGHNIWTKECRNCEPDGAPKRVPSIEVAVGAGAQLLVTWKTRATPGGEKCQEGGTVNGNAWNIWAVSLVGDVCSIVRVDSDLPESSGEQDLHKQDGTNQRPVTIKLSGSGDTVYSLDSFWLHIIIEDREGALELKENSCPLLLVHIRGSDGSSSLHEMSGRCEITQRAEQPGRTIRLDLASLGWGALGAPVEHSVQVVAVLGSPQAPQVDMVSSNTLKLRTMDPVTIPRTWGPESKGLAISLFLDKDIYLLGEDIPLRMAVKNFSADEEIASGELPCFAGLTFEVRNSNGQEVQTGDAWPCTGHGWLTTYPRDKVLPVTGVTLRGLGLLPQKPGKYTVAARWNAMRKKGDQSESSSMFGVRLTPFAVVLSRTVGFEVMSQPQ